MNTSKLKPASLNVDFLAALLNSVLITLVILAMDQGFSHHDWMFEFQNWIVCLLYIIIIFPSQYLISKYFFSTNSNRQKLKYMFLFGFPVTLFLLWLLFNKLH
ncbi:MAG: hypothetical protein R2831_11540 [Chitinophagaceae bacterium]